MTQKEFDKCKQDLDNLCKSIMKDKRPEYTNENEDVLHNFKQIGERLNISPLKTWLVYTMKGFESIISHVNNANLKEAESIKSRFADLSNYTDIGYALYKEERDVKKKNN